MEADLLLRWKQLRSISLERIKQPICLSGEIAGDAQFNLGLTSDPNLRGRSICQGDIEGRFIYTQRNTFPHRFGDKIRGAFEKTSNKELRNAELTRDLFRWELYLCVCLPCFFSYGVFTNAEE